MNEEIKKTKKGFKLVAGYGYNPGVTTLAKVQDTENGYIFKFPSYSSTHQKNYVCIDYSEAEYIRTLLNALALKESL